MVAVGLCGLGTLRVWVGELRGQCPANQAECFAMTSTLHVNHRSIDAQTVEALVKLHILDLAFMREHRLSLEGSGVRGVDDDVWNHRVPNFVAER